MQRLGEWYQLSCQLREDPKPWCLCCSGLAWLGMGLKTLPGVEQAGVLLVAPTSLQGRV